MPVDPQIQALLDRGTGVPATNTLSVAAARTQYEARIALMAPAADIATVTERIMQGRPETAHLSVSGAGAVPAAGVLPRQRLRFMQPGYA